MSNTFKMDNSFEPMKAYIERIKAFIERLKQFKRGISLHFQPFSSFYHIKKFMHTCSRQSIGNKFQKLALRTSLNLV